METFLTSLRQAGDSSTVLERIAEHFAAQTATLHLLGSDGMLRLEATAGQVPPAVLDAVRIVPVGKGIAGLTVERDEPVDLCNLQTDTSGTARPGARSTGVAGSICVPVRSRGRVIGALGIGTAVERTFTDAEIAVLLTAAEYVPAVSAGSG